MLLAILELAESLVKYEPGTGWLHRSNPLAKMALLIATFGLGIFAAAPGVPWYWGCLLFVVVCVIAISGGVPLHREFAQRRAFVTAIVAMYGLMNVFFGRGTQVGHTYLRIPPWFAITDASLQFAVNKTMFLLTSLVAITIVLKSTHLSDLTYSLSKVGVPYALSMITATSIRCVPMVTTALKTTYNAQRARGLELDRGSLTQRIRQTGYLLALLLLILLKMVDLMSIVFQSRGLDLGSHRRTHIRELPVTAVDWLMIVLSLGGLLALGALIASGAIRWQFAG